MATETKRYTLVAGDIAAKKAVVTPTNSPAFGFANVDRPLADSLGFKRCTLDARVVMRIEIFGDQGEREAYVLAEARRSRTLPENLTLNERDAIAYRMTQEVMSALDAALEAEIDAHLTRYLR